MPTVRAISRRWASGSSVLLSDTTLKARSSASSSRSASLIVSPERVYGWLGLLDKVTQVICERMAFDDAASNQVAMSVIEAGTNAIQHGHKRDPSKAVDVEFRLLPEQLEVVVNDEGPGFDVSRVNGLMGERFGMCKLTLISRLLLLRWPVFT